jgi:hypothetical protein
MAEAGELDGHAVLRREKRARDDGEKHGAVLERLTDPVGERLAVQAAVVAPDRGLDVELLGQLHAQRFMEIGHPSLVEAGRLLVIEMGVADEHVVVEPLAEGHRLVPRRHCFRSRAAG